MDTANLPSIHDAKLPANYQNAVKALQACSRLDECQEWAKKSEALASYAKQSKDDRLRKMADRIQARAIRRCGELLKQIEPGSGGQPYQKRNSTRDGTDPSSRTQAARDAGMSERQQKTAIRVANIPKDEFEQAIESDLPPSVTKLAEAGKKPGFKEATKALGTLKRLSEFCDNNNPEVVASGLMESEHKKARDFVSKIDSWLDVFISNIGE